MSDNPLDKYSSTYLVKGFADDVFNIKKLDYDVEKNRMTALVDITKHYQPERSEPFHLSTTTNLRIAGQLSIILTFKHLGIPKDREVYAGRDSWSYNRMISLATDIPYTFEKIRFVRRNNMLLCSCDIDVDDGAFTGQARWALKLD